MINRLRSSKRVTAASLGAALAGIALWALSTFAFNGSVPTEVSTSVPVLAAYVAGVLVPHEPRSSKVEEPASDSETH